MTLRQFVVAVSVLFVLVVRPAVTAGSEPTAEIDEARIAKEYGDAVRLAKRGDPDGYIELYRIAAAGLSAEISERARDRLHHFLYENPELWVKTFSTRVDAAKFKQYLTEGGIGVLDLPKGVTTHKEYANAIVTKLEGMKVHGAEKDLTSFILQLYREHPVPDDE